MSGISLQTMRRLLELDRDTAPQQPSAQLQAPNNYQGGLSAPESKARALGIPLEELKQRQAEQFKELMRKRQGYAGGGLIPETAMPWQNEARRLRGEHLNELAEPSSKAKGVLQALKSGVVGDTPGEMAFNALTIGAAPLRAMRPALGGLAALMASDEANAGILKTLASKIGAGAKPAPKTVQPIEQLGAKYMVKSPGVAKTGRVFGSDELEELRDALASYVKPRALSPERNKALTSILEDAQKQGVDTHVLYTGEDFTEPASVFQLQSEHDLGDIGNYMPNLVALLGSKGIGTQAIQEARRTGPYGLVSTPHSRPFYEKLSDGRVPNFVKHEDPDLDGIAYQFKKQGGLVENDDEFAYPGFF